VEVLPCTGKGRLNPKPPKAVQRKQARYVTLGLAGAQDYEGLDFPVDSSFT
jgi:hypothetical protein